MLKNSNYVDYFFSSFNKAINAFCAGWIFTKKLADCITGRFGFLFRETQYLFLYSIRKYNLF